MTELNYDPRVPVEPTSRIWKVIRFATIAFWIVVALWIVREYAPGVGHDVQREDQSVLVEDIAWVVARTRW
jgi:hypothetical protein